MRPQNAPTGWLRRQRALVHQHRRGLIRPGGQRVAQVLHKGVGRRRTRFVHNVQQVTLQ